MKRKSFTSPEAQSVGPYSHAVEMDGLVFLSGQTPLDNTTRARKGVQVQVLFRARGNFLCYKELPFLFSSR